MQPWALKAGYSNDMRACALIANFYIILLSWCVMF